MTHKATKVTRMGEMRYSQGHEGDEDGRDEVLTRP